MATGEYKHRGIVFRRCPEDESVWEVLDDAGIVLHTVSKGKLCRTTIDAMLDGSALPFDPGKKSRPKASVIPETSMMRVQVKVDPAADVSKDDMKKYEDAIIKKTAEATEAAEKKNSKIIIVDLSDIPYHVVRSLA